MTGYIYQIINIINCDSYIGCTKDLYKRLGYHVRDYNKLTVKNCKSKLLYKAIRKYGIENFIVRIIEQPLITKLTNRAPRTKKTSELFDSHLI
jgi:group I intron endonuclease